MSLSRNNCGRLVLGKLDIWGRNTVGKVNLKELAEQMDFMMDEWSHYVNRVTGEIISVENRHLRYAEDPDEIPERIAEWERDAIKQASAILESWDDLICFPRKYDLNEYGMMEDFIGTVRDKHIRECFGTVLYEAAYRYY